MSTIKKKNGKIIINNGRISCLCCDECCMYPAEQFGISHTQNDLPNEVIAPSSPDQYSIYTKSGERFLGTFTFEGETKDFEVRIKTSGGFTGWTWSEVDATSAETFPCLFGSAELQVFDTFLDTYSVSGTVSGTVIRESLCVWRGPDLVLSNYNYQWRVNGTNKIGNQNTPVGLYGDEYNVA